MTIYDIAAESGVSASTVSRVLNNEPRISEATRKRVLEVVEKYNFSPNAAARGLVSQSTKTVGILASDIRMPHYAESLYLLERELSRNGYCCILLNPEDSAAAMEEAVRSLAARRVDGIVMLSSRFQTPSMKKAIRKYIPSLPVVISNGSIDLPNVCGVLAAERHGLTDCVRYLVSRGRRQLVYVNNKSTYSNLQKRIGFTSGIEEAALGEPVVYEIRHTQDLQDGYDCTRRVIAERPGTDGIIFYNDLAAAGGLRALQELGRRVPEDVAVIGVDNSVIAETCTPRLTSLDTKIAEISSACASALLQVMAGKKVASKMLLFSDIVEREST